MKASELTETKVEPTVEQKLQTWYHGTSSRGGFDFIMSNGLKVDLDWIAKRYVGDLEPFKPLEGSYLTKDFGNAVRYSFHSDYDETFHRQYNKKEPTGYVFEFSGNDLSQISPDEDELGYFLVKLLKSKNLSPSLQKIANKAPEHLKRILVGKDIHFSWIAEAGKWLIQSNLLTAAVVKYIMKNNINIVNYGTLKPIAYWDIPKPNSRFLGTKTHDSFKYYSNYARSEGVRHTV